MEGRSFFSWKLAAFTVLAGGLMMPAMALGQAMGKVTLDASSPGSAPVLQSQITLAPTPPAPVPPAPLADSRVEMKADSKTAAPLPTIPAIMPVETPATAPATPEVRPENAVKGGLQPEKAADSLPADPSKAVAPLRAIEHEDIHGRTVGTASSDAGAGTVAAGAGKSVMPSGTSSVIQVLTAMTVVIGLIFLGKALAKKYLPAAKLATGKGVIEVLARYPLSKNQSLVLVRIGSQIVTLNQGKDQSHSVLVINDPNEVAKIFGQIEGTSPKSIQAGFNKLLSNSRMDLENPANDPDRNDFESRSMEPENLDSQLEEMAAAKRQLMDLRQQVRSVRDSLPR